MSFQGDLKSTFEVIHKQYLDSYEEFITSYDFEKGISLEDASEVVFNLKQYSDSMKEINKLFNFEKNEVSNIETTESKITKELERKMLPIMFLYRNILEVKYSNLPT
jgi:hypothetical protein